jgi:hypothetical protein
MTITATFISGYLFGEVKSGDEVFETKTFHNSVDYRKWSAFMEEFGDEDKITSVKWDCN